MPELEILVGQKIMQNRSFEIFTAVKIHSIIFSLMTPYNLIDNYPLSRLKHDVIIRINKIFRSKIFYKQKNPIPSIIFCDMTLDSMVDVYQYFGGTYCLHLQGSRIIQAARSKQEPFFCMLVPCWVYFTTLKCR